MLEETLKILTVLGWSATKYMFGISTALLMDYGFFVSLLLNVSGGMIGVVTYLYCWEHFLHLKGRFFPRKPKPFKMTKFKRLLVKMINRFGLRGISLLTPILLSVPLGSLLALGVEANKWKIKLYMFISFVFWSVFFMGILKAFGINPAGFFS